jgi:hypothetical protein
MFGSLLRCRDLSLAICIHPQIPDLHDEVFHKAKSFILERNKLLWFLYLCVTELVGLVEVLPLL